VVSPLSFKVSYSPGSFKQTYFYAATAFWDDAWVFLGSRNQDPMCVRVFFRFLSPRLFPSLLLMDRCDGFG
jgi:hypothetical protein